ncbi:MAG: hypothetical protein JNL50_03735 [Phycisphaerae bacterium]|nr:hypothetical protein [Phycisphaerae bacterium]
MHARRPVARSNSRIARLVGIAGLACGLAASSAHGQTLNWNNAAGGNAATSANWNPAQVPTAASLLVWNMANTYTVTWNSSVIASNTHTLKKGVVTYSLSAPHTIGTGGLKVGDVSGDTATLTLTTGTLNSTGAGIVGNATGSTGTLNVNDDDAELIITGAGADLTVGSHGPGTLNLTGGGLVQVADQFVGGNNASGTSTITLSGATNSLPVTSSRLLVLGTGESKFGAGGDTTVSITNGALADFAGDLVVSNGSASVSSLTVQGQGGLIPTDAELSVAGDLLLGRNTSSSAAGVATFNVNADGLVNVGGTLFVAGDPAGGSATLHMGANSLINTGSLNFGVGATLDLDGGFLNINGGVLTHSTGSTLDINGSPDNPVITMKNGATGTLPSVGGAGLRLGTGAGANRVDFDVRTGSDLVVNGNLLMGLGSDDFAGMIVNGVGSTLVNTGSPLIVGLAGDGRLEAELGGSISGVELWIARDATSVADVLFENPGTTAQFTEIYIGGSDSAAGGDGLLAVNHQAVLTIPGAGACKVYPIGKVDVAQSAVINAPLATFTNQGVIEMEDGGLLDAGDLTVTSGAVLRGPMDVPGASTVNARTHILTGGSLELVNGDLTVGDPASTSGFLADDGTVITVGANSLTFRDADRAVLDDITINGGEIVAPNGFEIFTPGQSGTLDGTGTITGEVFFESGGSVITATGAGITINGRLSNDSGMIDGTRYTFNHNPDLAGDSGWVGNGTINARVTFNSGAGLYSGANMTLGANATDGVVFNSGSSITANVGDVITLVDSNGVTLATTNTLDAGFINCAQPLTLSLGRSIIGTGELNFPTFTMTGGLISPSMLANDADPIGSLTFDPTVQFIINDTAHSQAEYFCQVKSLSSADHVFVDGAATLDGTITVEMLNGFQMPRGSRVAVMTISGPLNGWFSNLNLPWGHRLISFFTDDTVLQVFNCPPDVNSDGFVNGDDYDAFASGFEAGDAFADFNEDGFVNGDDYDTFASEFEMGC